MTFSYLGLLLELLLFAAGVYLYLFARGYVRFGTDEEVRARSESFRADNATWMRLLGLGLAAVMGLNIVLHLREIL